MPSVSDILAAYRTRVIDFEADASKLFSKVEQSKTRVIAVEDTRKRISGLSVQQNELLAQALSCVEYGIYRAAHVMAWAAFIDLVEEKLASDGLVKLKAIRPAWAKHAAIEEIRESYPEYQMVEVARDVGFLTKTECKSILGLLAKRNECAHPSGFKPDLNDSLGYVADLLKRVEKLAPKTL